MNLIGKSILNSRSIESKTITKLFDRLTSRRMELWNNKEISTFLTVPGTVSTTVRRKKWSKIQCEDTFKQVWRFLIVNNIGQEANVIS